MKTLLFFSKNNFWIYFFLLLFPFVESCGNPILTNPSTNKSSVISNDFESNFDPSDCVSISLGKMNVLYIGVENVFSINAPNVDPRLLKVSLSGGGGGSLSKGNRNDYIIKVTRPAPLGQECVVKVVADGIEKIEKFRVKRIPDPVAKLSGKIGGAIGVGEFKAQGGVSAILQNFDFDAKCLIQGYALTRIPYEQKAIEINNPGARYNEEARKIIDEARPGDIYTFNNVKARCPGDVVSRKINSMVFKIK